MGSLSVLLVVFILQMRGVSPEGMTTQCVDLAVQSEWTVLRIGGEEGREVYVEPSSFVVAASGEVLLLGHPTAVWARPDSGAKMVAGPSEYLGVEFRWKGPASLIPPPRFLSGPVGISVRAAEGPDQGWVVVAPGTDSVGEVQLWSGSYSQGAWSGQTPVPSSGMGHLRSDVASALVRTGDGYAMAMPVRLRNGENMVALFRSRADVWASEVLPVSGVAGVAVAHAEPNGLILALTRPDPSQRRDQNSLFLHVQSNPWHAGQLVQRGGDRPVMHAEWSIRPPLSLSWMAPTQVGSQGSWAASAAVDLFARSGPRVIPLAEGVLDLVGLGGVLGHELWMVTTRPDETGQRKLQIVHAPSGEGQVLHEIPTMFDGTLKAAWLRPDVLLVTGGAMVMRNGESAVETRVLRLEFSCGPAQPADDPG